MPWPIRILLRFLWVVAVVVALIQEVWVWPVRWDVAGPLLVLSLLVLGSVTWWARDDSIPAGARGAAREGARIVAQPLAANGATARAIYGAVSLVAVTLTGVGWHVGAIGSGTDEPRGLTGDPQDPAQFRNLLLYARSLDYDSVTHMAADEEYLSIKDTIAPDSFIVVRGPRAKIIPEKRGYRNRIRDMDGIGRGEGRVVAKIWVDPGFQYKNRQGYPKLSLPPGWSFVFIDNFVIRGKSGTARALIIPDRDDGAVILHPRPVTYYRERGTWPGRSQSFWRWDPAEGDPMFNTGGCPMGCCEVD